MPTDMHGLHVEHGSVKGAVQLGVIELGAVELIPVFCLHSLPTDVKAVILNLRVGVNSVV
jgi:hypothetical protein